MSAAILDNPLRMANRTQAPFFLLDRVLFIGTYLIKFFQDPKQASQTHVHSERERCGCRQGCRGQNFRAWHFSRWSQVHVSYSMGWVKVWDWQRDVQARVPWRNLAGIALQAKKLRTVPTIVIAHTICTSPDTRISYRQCILIQGYFCAV